MRRALTEAGLDGRQGCEKQQGVALVELAVVLPLLTFILLSIFDLGLVLREYQILQNAAREGARYSIHPAVYGGTQGATVAAIRQRVIDYMAQEGITVAAGDITVTQLEPVPVGGVNLRSSRVTVTYTRALLLGGAGILPAGQLTLSATSLFENLY